MDKNEEHGFLGSNLQMNVLRMKLRRFKDGGDGFSTHSVVGEEIYI